MMASRKAAAAAFALLAASCVGCSKPESSGTQPSPPAPAGGVKGGKLAEEAKWRPKGTPTAEAVLAAFTGAGSKIQDLGQRLGAPIGALYCRKAKTENGLVIGLCEYEDENLAVSSDISKVFPGMPSELDRNRKTSLILIHAPKTDKTVAEAKTLHAVFKGVPPSS
jgi:hypothetical protein